MRAQAFSIPPPVAGAGAPVGHDTADHAGRGAADRLILPAVRERLRVCLWLLAIAQGIYAVPLLLSLGTHFDPRAALNAIRLAVTFACVWQLRGEGTRRQTLTLAGLGLGTQFAVGVALSIVRQDVLPTALLIVVLACVTAVLIPWGSWVQGAVSLAAGLSLLVASALVYRDTGAHLGFDATVTILASLAVTPYIAHFLDQTRRRLERRLDAAQRTDEELTTLRDQLEKRVAERTAELEVANRELESFSHTVAHDLRSPLRAIAGFSQLILEESGEQIDETTRSSLVRIHAASRRMDGLIDDMLLLARVGRSALRYETVDLVALARSVGEELVAEQPDRKVDLKIAPVPPVRGDYALLRIAVDSLLRNAWKFTGTRETAHVTVSGESTGGTVICRVGDDGIGFDPRFRHKLFQPFERIHGDSCFAGSGIGLATVARIVHRHGGEVDAEGALDQGATFSMILPESRVGQ